ncbi:IS1634 family transposase [Rhodovibrio sodomensis]|uniref:IS1634 family transposase n=1 Tax=Rhodovibrio sodomensis TaxID=1088 RepID=A0ABS1DMU7_9PROT|nr:IS1634 family transposase [Rhodovibrio sodomensis]MBK1671331.1 IS1634 family transposase [Rhodovibrio sodomensis]
MYIESVPNRQSPPAVLLRESRREGGKIKKRTVANLSDWPTDLVEGLRTLLKGGVAVDRAEQALTISRSLPHGHVAAVVGMAEQLGLPKLLIGRRNRPADRRSRDLVLAMIAQRIIQPCSKLATVRALNAETAASSLNGRLGLGEVREHEVYAALDWLVARQPHIESALANRHLSEGTLMLYDVSSSYLEGRCCELARHGYSRDHRGDRPQIVYGLLCDPEGVPIAVEVFEGDTADPTTLISQINKLKKRFGLARVVLVGDRGMITSKRIREELEPAGLDWITALRAPAIRQLVDDGPLQLSLFDDRDLAEIAAPEQFPGERLVVCRNPELADERGRKREALLSATERALDKVKKAVQRRRAPLRGEAEIGQAVGAVLDRHKMAKHFEITITENSFSYRRKTDSIAAEARMDGIYVVRTNVPAESLSAEQAVRAYKSLGQVERAFRSLKTVDLAIRPVFHWAADRVRAHVFLCMLAYYVEAHMRQRLAPLLFDDHDPKGAEAERASVVAPAERSEAATRKAATRRTDHDLPVHSFHTLLADLGTLCLNTVSMPSNPAYSFDQPTQPTPLQAKAFELLGVSP